MKDSYEKVIRNEPSTETHQEPRYLLQVCVRKDSL